MKSPREIDALVQALRVAVSEVVPLVDAKVLVDIGYDRDDEASEAWVFGFCVVTQEAIRDKNSARVGEFMMLMAEHYQAGSAAVRECIEGNYVQHLLAGLRSDEKAWAWAFVPQVFRRLYVAIVGEPGSVRFENI